MKTCLDLAAAACSVPFLATWAMRPPLISIHILIAVVLVSCVLLFWVRSSAMLRQQMYDRLYGPGMKTAHLEWWEADLDPIFKRSVGKLVRKWLKKQGCF